MGFRAWEGQLYRGQTRKGEISPVVITSPIDGAATDAFGRQRISEPFTIFDSKQLFDALPFFWDDAETSGTGTGSTHAAATASTTMTVTDATAGKRTRQTFRRFNYQPGKSQLIFATFSHFDTATGNTKRVGYFDNDNGIFFQSSGGVLQVVIRTKTSGSVVETTVDQADWNFDKMDGSGTSAVPLNPSKSQIAVIDFEWLGVGRVRMGFVINGLVYYCHEFLNANNLDVVYMSTPNLPLRYEIENDGNGPADSFETICSTVISEGGVQQTGLLRSKSTAGVALDAAVAGTLYAVLGIRLKAAYVGTTIELERLSMLAEAKEGFEYSVLWNPTVAGTFTYSDETDSAVQTAVGVTANTVTGGKVIDSGYVASASALALPLENALSLGSSIAGVVDQIVVCARPLGINTDIQATLTWRELI